MKLANKNTSPHMTVKVTTKSNIRDASVPAPSAIDITFVFILGITTQPEEQMFQESGAGPQKRLWLVPFAIGATALAHRGERDASGAENDGEGRMAPPSRKDVRGGAF